MQKEEIRAAARRHHLNWVLIMERLRFMGALLIMGTHIQHVGVEKHLFMDSWIYVEFFLIITGFFTAKHFDGLKEENRAKAALQYTIRKFLPLFPYAFLVSFMAWLTQGLVGVILEGWTLDSFIVNFMEDFIFDCLLLSSTYTLPLVGPLWYISAMMLVFPVFSLITQIGNRYTRLIISYVIPLLYFGYMGFTGNISFPNDLLRVFSGMLLGECLYEMVHIIDIGRRIKSKKLLTFVELACFFFPIVSCCFNWSSRLFTSNRVLVFCFFIQLGLCLSGSTYTTLIHGKWCNNLGKLSMPLFIVHWYIGSIIKIAGEYVNLGMGIRVLVYFVVSICVSVILMELIERWKWFNNIKRDLFQ